MAKKRTKKKFDPNDPFVSMSDMMHGSTTTTMPATRKVGMSPAAKIRARSVGVSSSSRHRTHKPPGAKKKGKGY